MKRFSSYLSAVLTVLLLVIGTAPMSVAAQTVPPTNSSAALSIEPRKNYTINPGQTVNDKLTISNLSSTSNLTLSLRMIDFTFSNQSGTPKLYLAANAPQTPWSLKPYTTLPKNLTLSPGQTESFNYSITIPKNLGAGSYYSAIIYQSGTGNGGNVGLGAAGVTLVFVTVPGTVNENLHLQAFGAYDSADNGTTGSYVTIATNNAPQMIAYTLKNSGNAVEAPAGSITLTDMFGHAVKTLNKTNAIGNLALIGQTRIFATCVESKQSQLVQLGGTATNDTANTCVTPHLAPGLYTAKLDVFYGQNGNTTHEITNTAHFWYLPWWFIALVLIILALIAYAIWWLQRKARTLLKGTTYRSDKGIGRKR